MFRRAASTEEPRFLKDLLEALRDSEDELAEADAAAETASSLVLTLEPPSVVPDDPSRHCELAETAAIWAEIALLRELSAEWKEAVRIDREQTSFMCEMPIAA